MPTNVYFDTGTKSEQHLYEDLMIEQLKIYGQDVFYIPRTLVKEMNSLERTLFLSLMTHIKSKCILKM
jgi:hypothetical protein